MTYLQVTGFNPWQEITRPFAYDSQREVFYYMEADFLKTPPSLDKRPLYLYTIDAATGKGKQQVCMRSHDDVLCYNMQRHLAPLMSRHVTPCSCMISQPSCHVMSRHVTSCSSIRRYLAPSTSQLGLSTTATTTRSMSPPSCSTHKAT
jgi:hypothetical protein